MISVNKNSSTIESFYFRHPFTCMLAGPAQSGKTTLIQKIIRQAWGGLGGPARAPPCPDNLLLFSLAGGL